MNRQDIRQQIGRLEALLQERLANALANGTIDDDGALDREISRLYRQLVLSEDAALRAHRTRTRRALR